jgi:hypothetical protein
VRGKAYDGALAQDAACSLRRKVVLSKMDAICARRERYVNAVINNKPHAKLARYCKGRFGLSEKLARIQMLLAQLNHSRAAATQAQHLFGMREAASPCIRDGIKPRQREGHRG